MNSKLDRLDSLLSYLGPAWDEVNGDDSLKMVNELGQDEWNTLYKTW